MTTATPSMPGRRVFTAPLLQRKSANPNEEESAEKDLFSHPNAYVVSFNEPPGLERSGTPRGQTEEGTLPWISRFETFEYRGKLRLYEPKTEQTMLASWNKRWQLAMMPGTQCWCVDRQSKFAIKIRTKIYRIELPWETEEDKGRVYEFRKALDRVILLERTTCPFKRGYKTEIVTEAADSPKTKRRLIGKNKTYKLNEPQEARRPSMSAGEGSPEGSVEGSDEDVSGTPERNGDSSASHSPFANSAFQATGDKESQRSVTAPVLVTSKTRPPRVPNREVSPDRATKIVDGDTPLPQDVQDQANAATAEDETLAASSGIPILMSPPTEAVTDQHGTGTDQAQTPEAPQSSPSVDNDPFPNQPECQIQRRNSSSARISRSSLPMIYPADSPPRTPSRSNFQSLSAIQDPPVPATSPSQRPSTPPSAIPSEMQAASPRKTSLTPSTASSSSKATIPSTPPNQPPPKGRSTTLTSTSQVSSPSKFRNSSLISDDDEIPSLGVFSQALNILRGPPSGLIAVLMGFARRASNMGFGTNGAGGLGLGLSRSHSGSSERSGHQRRKTDMPGTWRFDGAVDNSEDEGPLGDESEEDDFGVPLHNGSKGRKARQRWGSPAVVDSDAGSRRASAADSPATVTSRQRQGPNEWTDSDLD